MKDWKNTLIRALRTFFQAAIGYILTAIGGASTGLIDAEGNISRAVIGGLIVSSVAAGLAALMNLPEKPSDVEEIDGAAVVKKVVEKVDDLPMAGQTSGNMGGAVAEATESAQASQPILRARAGEEAKTGDETPVQMAGQDAPEESKEVGDE